MNQYNYLVLRVNSPISDAHDPLIEPDWRSSSSPDSSTSIEYRIDLQTLSQQDERDLRHDPSVVAAARPMPLKLIQPVSASEQLAEPPPIHDATWGVYVTRTLQSPYVGHGVTVAVLDTGIDATHEAFKGMELLQKDFTGEGDGDQNGHGTHVAGTIFGRTGAGVRFGVAPGVQRALIGKVIGTQQSATTAELVAAVQWAVEGGAHIVNMSLGFDFPGMVDWWAKEGIPVDFATSRALAQYRDNVRFFDKLIGLLHARAAHTSSALIIAAAGNESRRELNPGHVIEVSPPAAAEGVMSVAALQTIGEPHDNLTVAPFSNIRAVVSAPGKGVYSAKTGGGYTYLSGTSMASPHVAGVAALWAERQLKSNGVVNITSLDAQLRATAQRDPIKHASYLDVGEGLVTAPVT
jgi:subtilisin family serine protease